MPLAPKKIDATLQPTPTSGLPSPRDLPSADVLIFDGKCKFCIGQVKKVRWLDGTDRVAFVSLHDPWVAQQFPDLTYDMMMERMYLIPASEPGYSDLRLGGVLAVRYLTCHLPRLWVLAPLLHLPFSLPLWQWGYSIVARYRYELAGKVDSGCDEDGTCELHFGNKK